MRRTFLFCALVTLAFPNLVSADTIYTYAGNPFTSCSGTFTCNGTTPYVAVTFTVASGTPLNNLTLFGTGSNITASVLSFSFTDGTGLSITQTNASYYEFNLGTDASGNITGWYAHASNSPPGGNGPGAIASTICNPATFCNDGVIYYNFVDGSGTSTAEGNTSFGPGGTWTMQTNVVPEPATVLLFSTGLAGLWWRRRRI